MDRIQTAQLAQSVEQQTWNLRVVALSPTYCWQEFFILYFVVFDALLTGRLVPWKWNKAWRPSEVYRCIERMIIWKKNGGGTSSLVHDSLRKKRVRTSFKYIYDLDSLDLKTQFVNSWSGWVCAHLRSEILHSWILVDTYIFNLYFHPASLSSQLSKAHTNEKEHYIHAKKLV